MGIKKSLRLPIVPDYLLYLIVICFFLMPYVALKFSYLPLVGSLNSFFIIMVLIFFFILFLRELKIKKKYLLIIFTSLTLFSYGVIQGVLSGYSLPSSVKFGYDALVPLIFLSLILISKASTLNIKFALIKPLLLVAVLNAIYSIYQYYFIHDFKQLWFYEPLTSKGFELHKWSFENDGQIRAVGFFTSALENAFLLGLVSFYYLLSFSLKKHILYLFLMFFYLWIGYLTGTRVFFIGFFVGVISWLFVSKFKRSFIVPSLIIPFLGVVVTYMYLFASVSSLDLSATGRLIQLTEMLSLVSANLLGTGFGAVGIGADYSFDSAYATWFISLGLFAIGVVVVYAWLIKKLLEIKVMFTGVEYILVLTIALFLIEMMYISQFQYALLTSTRWYVVLVAGLLINKSLMYRKGL